MPSHDHDHHEGNNNTNTNNDGLVIHHKKSISRVLSKEVSQPNSSCRVYYGEAAGAVPFVWEVQPGTPKHTLFDSSPLPPLTPPPSFSSSAASIASKSVRRSHSKLLLMTSIFARSVKRPGSSRRKLSSSFSLSSLSSHSSSSSSSSSKARRNVVPFDYVGAHEYYNDHDDHDDDSRDHSPGSRSSPTSTLCYPAVKNTAWRFVTGCYAATVNVKNARLH